MNALATASMVTLLVTGLVSGCSMGHDEAGHAHSDEDGAHTDAAIGKAGDPAAADRTIRVEMDDQMRYTPSSFEVGAGETIAFEIVNVGKLRHEFTLGSSDAIAEHHELMMKFPGMEHDEPNSVSLAADEQGSVVWQFGESGTVDIACLEPGHLEAGMRASVTVAER